MLLYDSFNIIFRDTAWPNDNDKPGVTNIFWYNYHDTGVNLSTSDCGQVSIPSPSYAASFVSAAQLANAEEETEPDIPWEFGLYDGNVAAKDAQCAFRAYPQDVCIACDIGCSIVYLPIIVNDGLTAQVNQ